MLGFACGGDDANTSTGSSNDGGANAGGNASGGNDGGSTSSSMGGTLQPGELTYPIIRPQVEAILLVSEEEVIKAMTFLLLRLKILAEPTGAVAPAAVLEKRIAEPGRKVGVIISGGNVDAILMSLPPEAMWP